MTDGSNELSPTPLCVLSQSASSTVWLTLALDNFHLPLGCAHVDPIDIDIINNNDTLKNTSSSHMYKWVLKEERLSNGGNIDLIHVLNSLQHKSLTLTFVVPVWCTLWLSTRCYTLMPYVGGSLQQLIDDGQVARWSAEQVRVFLAQVSCALESIQECGIVHRDLKPSNICINKQNQPFLIDFGLSQLNCGESGARCFTEKETATKSFESSPLRFLGGGGTLEYVAPEVILGVCHQAEIGASDYWSLGVLACFLLTGVMPFSALSHTQLTEDIFQCHFAPNALTAVNALDTHARELIFSLLCVNPAERLNAATLKRHPFFDNIDFAHIKDQAPHFAWPLPPDIERTSLLQQTVCKLDSIKSLDNKIEEHQFDNYGEQSNRDHCTIKCADAGSSYVTQDCIDTSITSSTASGLSVNTVPKHLLCSLPLWEASPDFLSLLRQHDLQDASYEELKESINMKRTVERRHKI